MPHIDEQIQSQQDSIFLTKVARAKERSGGDKLLDGPRLFDLACQRMRDGIRHQFPEFVDAQVESELRRRLKIKRAIDEKGLFCDAGIIDAQ